MQEVLILGAGMTGLAAGTASGFPVFEASDVPGGICSSYYVRPGGNKRLPEAPEDGEAYRFELGGGHWIFGGEPGVLDKIRSHVALKSYARRSSVYFREKDLYVPYPIQNHLRFLDHETAKQALSEMSENHGESTNMKAWLKQSFGETLCELFFNPFHELYTAGLYGCIAPQDAYKSPVDMKLVRLGASDKAPEVGYNVTFVYPEEDLGTLARSMAEQCNMNYGKSVKRIDLQAKDVLFEDGTSLPYKWLLSTLPLNRMMEMTGLYAELPPEPHTSVLVLNIGAVRGGQCPVDHWLYTPDTCSGFHRVGFYSNVDPTFLPTSARADVSHAAIYVERSFEGGARPSELEIQQYADRAVQELQEWEFIGDAKVVDPTWIDVAYTWGWPDSNWRERALKKLKEHEIHQVGRYARWGFQGIADSIRDGFIAGKGFHS